MQVSGLFSSLLFQLDCSSETPTDIFELMLEDKREQVTEGKCKNIVIGLKDGQVDS